MILQYFKSKENKYKKISNNIYSFTIEKSKDLIKNDFFKEVSFEISFELLKTWKSQRSLLEWI